MDITDRFSPHVPVWEHTCCGGKTLSAAQRCDRCGTPSRTRAGYSPTDLWTTLTSKPLTKAPVMAIGCARSHRIVPPVLARVAARPGRADEDEAAITVARVRAAGDDLDRALLFGVWLLAGIVTCVLGIGATVEFQAGHFASFLVHALSASAPPVAVVIVAISGAVRRSFGRQRPIGRRGTASTVRPAVA